MELAKEFGLVVNVMRMSHGEWHAGSRFRVRVRAKDSTSISTTGPHVCVGVNGKTPSPSKYLHVSAMMNGIRPLRPEPRTPCHHRLRRPCFISLHLASSRFISLRLASFLTCSHPSCLPAHLRRPLVPADLSALSPTRSRSRVSVTQPVRVRFLKCKKREVAAIV